MSGVWTTIDFSQPGDQADFLRVPFSSDRSAYGWVPVPMFCLGSGAGPTALLTAGTHGDEYEGQIILRRLLSLLRGRPIAGRVILLPALNQPAVAAGLRNSPLDGGNLNRAFPGQPNAGVTAAIADYVTRVLFPLADLAIDLHSGGGSLDYLPVAFAHAGRTVDHAQRTARLLDSFAAPYSIVTNGRGGGGGSTLYGAAAAMAFRRMVSTSDWPACCGCCAISVSCRVWRLLPPRPRAAFRCNRLRPQSTHGRTGFWSHASAPARRSLPGIWRGSCIRWTIPQPRRCR